jgi:hypothetical protein
MDAEGSELLACKQGLALAREAQSRKIVLETDSAAEERGAGPLCLRFVG